MLGEGRAGDTCKNRIELGLEYSGSHAFKIDKCFRFGCTAKFFSEEGSRGEGLGWLGLGF